MRRKGYQEDRETREKVDGEGESVELLLNPRYDGEDQDLERVEARESGSEAFQSKEKKEEEKKRKKKEEKWWWGMVQEESHQSGCKRVGQKSSS